MSPAPVYLDCAATTPVDPRVAQVWLREVMASGTGHQRQEAARLEKVRADFARTFGASAVYFTSGCTEANNRALTACAWAAAQEGRRHILSTQIEHPAVMDVVTGLRRFGFEVELLAPEPGGWVSAEEVLASIRPDTGLVSVMHANNLTGVVQPIAEIAAVLEGHPALFHVDGAQGFAKAADAAWMHPRIDYYAASAHKHYGPKGVGFLLERAAPERQTWRRDPLGLPLWVSEPASTMEALPQVMACVEAARLGVAEGEGRRARCEAFGARLRAELGQVGAIWIGDDDRRLSNAACVRFEGLMADEVMLALEPFVAISSTSACSTASMKPSHVLQAMGVGEFEARGVVRLTWWHGVEPDDVDWTGVREALEDAL